MSESSITVRMPSFWSWLFPVGVGAIGFGLGFAVRPLFAWMMDLFDTAPGPLRVAATLPTFWAVLALTVVGGFVGAWLASDAYKQALMVTVDRDGVELTQDGHARYIAAERVASAMLDGKELVLLDDQTREQARYKADDLNGDELAKAFTAFGHHWEPGNPYDERFERWVDGRPGLAEPVEKLLRERGRAIADGKVGTIEALTDRLRDEGVAVRDRGDSQEYRLTG